MSDTVNVETLRQLAFFRDMSDDQLEQLAAASRQVELREREVVFEEHDPTGEVFVVVSGQVSLVICVPQSGCRQIHTVGAGELIGWSPLLEQTRLSATGQTLTPATLIALNAEKVRGLCSANPAFGYALMRRVALVLAERLYATRIQMLDLAGVRLPETTLESD